MKTRLSFLLHLLLCAVSLPVLLKEEMYFPAIIVVMAVYVLTAMFRAHRGTEVSLLGDNYTPAEESL